MKIKSKAILAALCAALLVAGSVFGTLAYLTDQTEKVKNTFIAGDLFEDTEGAGIILKEHEAKPSDENDGTYVLDTNEIDSNTYTILPGVNVPKDPFVKVTELEVPEAYLFIEVVGLDSIPTGISATVNTTNWTLMTDATGRNGGKVYKYRNDGIINQSETTGDSVPNLYILAGTGNGVFENGYVVVDPAFDAKNLDDPETEDIIENSFDLKFYAYICQATGIENAEKAWTSAGFEADDEETTGGSSGS